MLFRKKKKKTCVVGLDGVPFTLLGRLTEQGVMPNFKNLIQQGHLHQMKVTLPEISAVSWPSFMTGTGPGAHGIFGFTDLKPNSYSLRFPNYRDVKAMSLWDKLENRRKRSVILNQPGTYPAQEVSGALVSGFVAIDLKKAIWPMKYRSDLQKMGYQVDIDTVACRDDHDLCIRQLRETLEGRKKAFEFFNKAEDWDYFQVVVTGTDRLHHYLWDALDDTDHRLHDDFLDYYRRVDEFIGWVFQKFSERSGREDPMEGFFMLSDHGFTGIKQEFYLTKWLQEQGYLSFESEQPESLEEISEGSKAFALDPGRIYVNRAGRFPKGCVSLEDSEPLMEEISQKLLSLEFSGEKVIEAVHRGTDVYSGPYVEDGPDLVPVSRYGFDLKAGLKAPEMFTRSSLVGMHTWDDAFFLAKTCRKNDNEDLHITEISSIIMDSF